MELRCFISYITVILHGIALIECDERFSYIVSFPKQFRVDTNNAIVISADGIHQQTETFDLTIKCGEYQHKEKIIFNKDGIKTSNIIIPSSKVPSSVQHVTIELVNGEVRQEKTVPLIKSSGFIFIQTDKPIYSPRQNVTFRVLAINEDQSPSNRKVTVDITNPSGIILDRMTYEGQDAFEKKDFQLPAEADLGLWNISATFGKDFNMSVVEFEVKEYVLPTFGVTIKPQETVINKTLNFLNIDVEARYAYTKQGVKGKCTLRLGYIDDDQIVLFKKKYKTKLKLDGNASFRIPMKSVLKSYIFPQHGTPLFIEVNVTERVTKIQETGVDMTTVFATKPYKIEFTSSKSYFLPKYPYQLHVDILDVTNRPVSGISVKIDWDQQKESFETQTDQRGRCIWVIREDLTKAVEELKFIVNVAHGQKMESSEKFVVKKGYHFATISLSDNDLLSVQKTMDVKVRFEHEESRLFFFMIASKGRIIWTDSFYSDDTGTKIVHIPDKYKDELSPFARVIVYHHDSLQLKADSVTIDFPNRCLDELQLLHSKIGITSLVSRLDGRNKIIKLKGSPGMNVGLVAVDKSVYYLNDKISLTKESLQKEMLKRDTEMKTIQSQDGIDIFDNNGLLVLHNMQELYSIEEIGVNRKGDRLYNSHHYNDLIPYKKIRKFFPESFMFSDAVLNSRGTYKHRFKLPDTVTTWVVHAVGLSASRGLCVADPIEFHAYLPFHTKLQLPHKVVRLEQVKVKLSVYNNKAATKFKVNITGDTGLCFPRWEAHCGSIRKVKKNGISSCEFDVIPFKTGDLAIRVGVWNLGVNPPKLVDAIEKKLYVVAEGKRLRKTITFALNPEGNKDQSVTEEKIVLDSDSLTDNDANRSIENIQQTEVDLALPTEIIPGTESCGIQACGDLMGDVISTVMFDTGDVFVSSFYDGEEVIGNLAPIVYALEYLNALELLSNDIYSRSRRSITKGVTQLMKYRNKYGPFSLNKDALPSTWFTALVLKTLCQTRNIQFIDDRLINDGFLWILDQVDEEGRPKELEFRLPQKNKNYTIMLAAEILIAQRECNISQEHDHHVMLQVKLAVFLEENIHSIENPLVLSKMAYALQLAESPESEKVISQFIKAAKSSEGLTYWSDNGVEEGVPLWYRQGSDSYSIETTAYGLLLYLNNPKLDPNPLADWLIRKRNRNGGFVSPTDTAIAIQALAKFSKLKHTKTTDLHLEISSEKYNEVLNFNTENAIQQKEVRDVPVGNKLNIKTKGHGLGQMKVRVAYNVPTTPNDHCMFDLTVERKETTFPKRYYQKHYSICKYCQFGCDLDKNKPRVARSARRSLVRPKKNKKTRRNKKTRKSKPKITKKSLCLKICLRYRGVSKSGPTNVEIQMLSGYKPLTEDLNLIKELSGSSVMNAKYNDGMLTVYLSEVSNQANTCLYLRIKEDDIINYLQPVPVVVFQPSRPEEICLKNYDVGHLHQSLPVYCIEGDNMLYKRPCQCLSESCGGCKKTNSHDLKKKFCASDVVYNITIDNTVKSEASKDISAILNKVYKQGEHDIDNGKIIELRTSLACSCPNFKSGEPLVLVGNNPFRFVNRKNEEVYRYIVDETTTFVNVTESRGPKSHGRTTFLGAFHSHHKICPDP